MNKVRYPQSTNNPHTNKSTQLPLPLSQQKRASVLSLKFILKNNLNSKLKDTLKAINSHSHQRYTFKLFLCNKILYIFKKKYSQRRNQLWSVLLNMKLQSHFKNSEKGVKIKKVQQQKAVQILSTILKKLQNKRLKNTLHEIKFRTLLIQRLRVYKTLHLSNIVQRLRKSLQRRVLNILKENSFKTVLKGKSFYHLQKFMSEKPKTLQIQAFQALKQLQKKQPNQKSKIKQPAITIHSPILSDLTISQQEKELQQKKVQLETQLKQIQKNNRISKQKLQKEVQKLEGQFQGLKFNNQVLEQENKQIDKAVQLRQNHGSKKLSQNEVWESVYYSLLAFLNAKQNSNSTTVKKEEIILAMEVPLIQCGIKLDQLMEQNKILQQLLQAYKQNFPQPQHNSQQEIATLPYEILKKQNKFYLQTIQILSGWGTNDAMQVNQLKNELSQLRKHFQ